MRLPRVTIDTSKVPPRVRNRLIFTFDAALVPISLYAALCLRLGTFDPINRSPFDPLNFVLISVSSIALLLGFQLYRYKLRTFDIYGIQKIGLFSVAIALLAVTISYFLNFWTPRSISLIYGMMFFLFANASRLLIQSALNLLDLVDTSQEPVAIYGAGTAGIRLASMLRQSSDMRPVVFVDDNRALKGLIIAGLRIRRPSALRRMAELGRINRVLIAIPSLSQLETSNLVDKLSDLDCEIQVVPSYVDLIYGGGTIQDPMTIYPDDLLARETIDLGAPEIARAYAGRCVLVTGAGGSIGSELCRQLLDCAPRRIVLFEQSEHALYEINRLIEPIATTRNIPITARLASVTNKSAVEEVLQQENVEIVLHAAAYKHVPIVEENELEGISNNVFGTHIVAEAASAHGIERFILVSSDKAVRPTNVMGATKRMAELIVQDLQSRTAATKFAIVRFGNVLGSSGSVVPLFQSQISSGGPVTVTHEDTSRYFMTIREAVGLILTAGASSSGDDLFILDMGDPVKIIDVAKRMITLSGRTVRDAANPHGEIEIEVTGLRAGEKMHEELFTEHDTVEPTHHDKIMRANVTQFSQIEVAAMLKKLDDSVERRDIVAIRSIIKNYVDGYAQPETVASS